MGAPQAAIPLVHRAMRLDPGSSYLTQLVLGRAHFYLDQPDQALVSLREAVARNPAYLESHLYLAAVALRAGDRDLAEWEALEILNLSPGFSPTAWLATYPMTDRAQVDHLHGALTELGLSTGDATSPIGH
jgi:predicted Zn-dependent protease